MRKEFGSDFHFMEGLFKNKDERGMRRFFPDAKLCFSGRAALYHILDSIPRRDPQPVLWIPDYYCYEVEKFLSDLPLKISCYEDGPLYSPMNLSDWDQEGNIFLWVNYFGLRASPGNPFRKAFLIEDHTHDPFSEAALNSRADYCFASLRKTLPLPAGGIYWSPRRRSFTRVLPAGEIQMNLFSKKLAAMQLKGLYLKGAAVKKESFRTLFGESETAFEKKQTLGTVSAQIQDLINSLSVELVRERRRENFQLLAKLLNDREKVLNSKTDNKSYPLGMVFVFESQKSRDDFKLFLIRNNIYPAVLWPNQKTENAKDFSERMLLVHCDCRHTKEDIQVIATIINQNST